MPKDKDLFEMDGEITEVLPGQMYRIKLDDFDKEVVCYTGGKMKKNKIRLVLGDRVKVEMSPYDLEKGRIIFRI
jgi:translation initiation factor IF-1